jgi:hypothetical protein
MPPTCQVTDVLERLATVAEKLTVPPSRSWLAPLTVIDGGGVVWFVALPQPLTRVAVASAESSAMFRWRSRDTCKGNLRCASADFQQEKENRLSLVLDENLGENKRNQIKKNKLLPEPFANGKIPILDLLLWTSVRRSAAMLFFYCHLLARATRRTNRPSFRYSGYMAANPKTL